MELLELVKMLFKSSPKDSDTLILKGMKNFPFKGYKYMMWCGYLIYRGDTIPTVSSTSMIHETIHLKQAQVKGSWVKYYWSYLVEWLKGNPIINTPTSAYYTIPYEMEAYANEDNLDYAKSYNGKYLSCYKKDRKLSTYIIYGGSFKEWKAYLKTIKLEL